MSKLQGGVWGNARMYREELWRSCCSAIFHFPESEWSGGVAQAGCGGQCGEKRLTTLLSG